jgi:hypothetical protein
MLLNPSNILKFKYLTPEKTLLTIQCLPSLVDGTLTQSYAMMEGEKLHYICNV